MVAITGSPPPYTPPQQPPKGDQVYTGPSASDAGISLGAAYEGIPVGSDGAPDFNAIFEAVNEAKENAPSSE